MIAASSDATVGVPIAVGVVALAAFFAWRQGVERRGRDDGLSAEDRAYFAGKDRRRFSGAVILALIGAGMLAGLSIDFRASPASGHAFVWTWAGVAGLVLVSLVLALADWRANLLYARRHRRALIETRLALIREELRARRSSHASQGGPDGANGASSQRG